jgi:UDP-glucose 4-epimerase
MDADKTLKNPFIQVVEDHIASGDPPETKAAVDQLLGKGRSQNEAVQLVSRVVQAEMSDMMAKGRDFDNAKYAADLKKMLAAES